MKCINCKASFPDNGEYICMAQVGPFMLKKSKMWGCSFNGVQVDKVLREQKITELYRVICTNKTSYGCPVSSYRYFTDRPEAVKFSSHCIEKFDSVKFDVIKLNEEEKN